MSDKPKVKYEARDFQGVVLQADAFDLKPGVAQIQENVKSDEQGRATVRLGVRTVSFDYSA